MALASPVLLSNITVKSASLSVAKVTPPYTGDCYSEYGQTGTGNGISLIKVHVNDSEKSSHGVLVNSGATTQVNFDISRNEPGTY